MRSICFSLLVAACTITPDTNPASKDGTADTQQPEVLSWHSTCGDPACGEYRGPFDGVPLCSTEVIGEACDDASLSCDPESFCNSLLVCAATDPKGPADATDCPSSRASTKRDITYLDGSALEARAQEALSMKLATWAYKEEVPGARPHMGFVIDDAPHSAAVRDGGDRVDLYGYTSLTLAAVQVQQQQIEAMRAEIAALQEALAAAGSDAACDPPAR